MVMMMMMMMMGAHLAHGPAMHLASMAGAGWGPSLVPKP